MNNTIRIPKEMVKFHTPHYNAKTNYSCGAASVRVLASYYGFGPSNEISWRKIIGTTKEGTSPSHIARSLRHFGLKVLVRKNLTIEQLTKSIDENHPVICPIQAWGTYYSYRNIMAGHYVIVIGYDDKNLYFEDSTIKRLRGWMTQVKFFSRWHDFDLRGTYFNQSGLIVKCPWEPVREYNLFKAVEIK